MPSMQSEMSLFRNWNIDITTHAIANPFFSIQKKGKLSKGANLVWKNRERKKKYDIDICIYIYIYIYREREREREREWGERERGERERKCILCIYILSICASNVISYVIHHWGVLYLCIMLFILCITLFMHTPTYLLTKGGKKKSSSSGPRGGGGLRPDH